MMREVSACPKRLSARIADDADFSVAEIVKNGRADAERSAEKQRREASARAERVFLPQKKNERDEEQTGCMDDDGCQIDVACGAEGTVCDNHERDQG